MLEIIKEPNPLLHKKSADVSPEEINDDLRKILSDMGTTMYAVGGVGLAAPQIGDLRRFLVADLSYARTVSTTQIQNQYGKELIKMINPVIMQSSGSSKGPEGCLSVPGFQQSVERSSWILVEYLDEYGEKQERIFENFLAVIIQHEIDHLNGVTLLSHSGRLKRSKYLKKLKYAKN